MRNFYARVLMLFLVSSACQAHQDQVLKLQANGTISGIPTEYGPGRLQLVFKNKVVSTAQLTLGTNTTKIPSCILRLLKSSSTDNIHISASWHHQETNLPFYLNIGFLDAEQNVKNSYKSGYSLLFNLRTSRLIYLRRDSVVNNGKSMQGMRIDISKICTQSETRQVSGRYWQH